MFLIISIIIRKKQYYVIGVHCYFGWIKYNISCFSYNYKYICVLSVNNNNNTLIPKLKIIIMTILDSV